MLYRPLCYILILFVTILAPSVVQAHRDDYINETFVYQTLQQRELELEYWLDYHDLTHQEAGHYVHTLSAEYGITNYWMADFALNYGNLNPTRSYELSRWRIETRRRLGQEGQRFPDLALSLELEAEHTNQWEYQLTPRVVLSHDVQEHLNTTLNLFVAIGLESGNRVTPGYNVGLRYPGEGALRAGIEAIQLFNRKTSGLLMPQLWVLPWPEVVLKLGYAKTFGPDEADYVRVAIEAEI